jgi:DNA mismatch endonuclease, patch repair protein
MPGTQAGKTYSPCAAEGFQQEFNLQMEKVLRAMLPGGAFSDVPLARSQSMSRIRGKNNGTTEKTLRMALVRSGVRGWSMHPDLLGRPDFYFSAYRLAVFVDGCFWHACKKCGHVPRTRSEFWRAKLERNRQRDRRVGRQLRAQGIRVVRIWEHRLNSPECVGGVLRAIRRLLNF